MVSCFWNNYNASQSDDYIIQSSCLKTKHKTFMEIWRAPILGISPHDDYVGALHHHQSVLYHRYDDAVYTRKDFQIPLYDFTTVVVLCGNNLINLFPFLKRTFLWFKRFWREHDVISTYMTLFYLCLNLELSIFIGTYFY